MSNFEIIIERNKRKFSKSLSEFQLKLLTREKSHLFTKAQQRPLSTWEVERLQELEQELTEISARMAPQPPPGLLHSK